MTDKHIRIIRNVLSKVVGGGGLSKIVGGGGIAGGGSLISDLLTTGGIGAGVGATAFAVNRYGQFINDKNRMIASSDGKKVSSYHRSSLSQMIAEEKKILNHLKDFFLS